MATTTTSNSILLTPLLLLLLLFLLPHTTHAATANLTDILIKNGAFSTFLRLLNTTQAITQIENQLNFSTEGLTVFAPTDNAFRTLKSGALNSLTQQQQAQLIQYHILPKFYTWDNFQTISNPVQTQASGKEGNWGLNIISYGVQQANVSTGVVETPINNALSQTSPLAVYQVEMVLLPEELFGTKAPVAPVASPSSPSGKKNSTGDDSSADGPVSDSDKSEGSVLTNLWGLMVAATAFGTMFLL